MNSSRLKCSFSIKVSPSPSWPLVWTTETTGCTVLGPGKWFPSFRPRTCNFHSDFGIGWYCLPCELVRHSYPHKLHNNSISSQIQQMVLLQVITELSNILKLDRNSLECMWSTVAAQSRRWPWQLTPLKTYLTPDELSYKIWSLHAKLYERTQVKNYPLT